MSVGASNSGLGTSGTSATLSFSSGVGKSGVKGVNDAIDCHVRAHYRACGVNGLEWRTLGEFLTGLRQVLSGGVVLIDLEDWCFRVKDSDRRSCIGIYCRA